MPFATIEELPEVKLLILGATGLVGSHVLHQALDSKSIETVIAPTRRPLPPHPKLDNPIAPDLGSVLPLAMPDPIDAMICTVGTSPAKAGSKEAFRYVDYVLPLQFAQAAHERGARACAVISSPGASLSIPIFYCRTKGEMERDMRKVGFDALTIIRPGMIGGDRTEFRLAERAVMPIAALLRPILPKGLRINPAPNIARRLLAAVVDPVSGFALLTSKDMA